MAHADAPDRVRRNMPDPIPVMVIGRLAMDVNFQGRGIGPALLRDAILRTLQAAEIAGIRAILVHATSDRAKLFFEKCGFTASPIDPMTLVVTVKEAAKTLGIRPRAVNPWLIVPIESILHGSPFLATRVSPAISPGSG